MEQKDTERTEAKAISGRKKTGNVATVAVAVTRFRRGGVRKRRRGCGKEGVRGCGHVSRNTRARAISRKG